MKTKLIRLGVLTAVLLGFAASARADVLVYNLTLTNRLLGGGANTTVIARGKFFHDIDTGDKVMMYRYTLGSVKLYEVHCDNFAVKQVVLPAGTNTVLVNVRQLSSEFDPNIIGGVRILYARGGNAPFELRPQRTESVAQALRGISREIVDAIDDNSYVIETGLEAILNAAATVNANTNSKSLAELVLAQRSTWEDLDFALAVDDCQGTLP